MNCFGVDIIGILFLITGVILVVSFFTRRYRAVENSTPARVDFMILGSAMIFMGLLLFLLGQIGMMCGGPNLFG